MPIPRTKRAARLCAALAGLAVGQAAAAEIAGESAPVRIVTSMRVIHWRALPEGEVDLGWRWPEGAQSARLVLSDGTAEKVAVVARADGAARAAWPWCPPLPSRDADQALYDASVTFHADAEATGAPLPGEALSVRALARVRGAGGTAFTLRPGGVSAAGWGNVAGRRLVLPTRADTTNLLAGAESLSAPVAPGWASLALPAFGTYALVLQGAERDEAATVTCLPGGVTILLR